MAPLAFPRLPLVRTAALGICFGLLNQLEVAGQRQPLLQVDAKNQQERSDVEHIPASEGAYGAVVKLNDQIFRGNVLRQDDDHVGHWMVYYCPEWWEPCQNMLQTYKKLAVQWQGNLNADELFRLQVRFARVDCATDKVLCNAMSVNDYPMVHHYSGGQRVASWSASSHGRPKDPHLQFTRWVAGELRKAADIPTETSTVRAALHVPEHAWDALLVLALLAVNCWAVLRSPLLLQKEAVPQRAESGGVATAAVPSAAVAPDASDFEDSASTFAERVLPEEWLHHRLPGASMEL